jgi:hypothetical protein
MYLELEIRICMMKAASQREIDRCIQIIDRSRVNIVIYRNQDRN